MSGLVAAGSSVSLRFVRKVVATRMMDLLASRPWILPALRRPERIGFARGGIRIAFHEFEKRALEEEHAASAASGAFPPSVLVDRKH